MKSAARLISVAVVTAALGFSSPSSGAAPPAFGNEKTSWHGFDRYDFLMDETDLSIKPYKAAADEGNAVRTQVKGQLRCVVVAPREVAAGSFSRRWYAASWRASPTMMASVSNTTAHDR
ncbi:MAG TPA: hypothetical protein VHC22_17100 [Pirellulales bacterium]|nr:hypothetical protein [Pirellulales bacterium]